MITFYIAKSAAQQYNVVIIKSEVFDMLQKPNAKTHTDLWCIHSYYTLSPYAPDGSGRLLFAGCDLETGKGRVCIADKEGNVLDSFGENGTSSSFFHTGYWQTWSPDAKKVYYQGGTNTHPKIICRTLETGEERIMDGDMEGAPPFGEPITSGLMGMLYAAGYGDGVYAPEKAPVPFQARDKHGLFRFSPSTGESKLALSVAEVLESHPDRDRLMRADRDIKRLYGENDGLTLMCYCLRWSAKGNRFVFYFGNHTVGNIRKEPKIGYVFTADKDLKDIHMAVDLSFGRRGAHWSMHPDGVRLVGYGPSKDDPSHPALSMVNYDGTDYHNFSSHDSCGHPSICPGDYNIAVTDEHGCVLLIDVRTGKEIDSYELPWKNVDEPPYGRSRFRVCHHPVFSADGTRFLCNTLPGKNAQLVEFKLK